MHLQCTISDKEVRRLGMRGRVKTRNDNGLQIWIFLQKLPFSVGKKYFKDKFRKYNNICRFRDIRDQRLAGLAP